MYKSARIKRDLLKEWIETCATSSFFSPISYLAHPPVSPSRRGSYSPRLRDPAHNPMAICRRRVNVTREIIKSSRGTRAAISDDDAAAPALHIKRPYPHRRRRRGTRADCVNAAMHTKACRACARTYFAIQKGSDWGKGNFRAMPYRD